MTRSVRLGSRPSFDPHWTNSHSQLSSSSSSVTAVTAVAAAVTAPPVAVTQLIVWCWDQDPTERVRASNVLAYFELVSAKAIRNPAPPPPAAAEEPVVEDVINDDDSGDDSDSNSEVDGKHSTPVDWDELADYGSEIPFPLS
jgi:hypothetical protein